MIMINEHYDTRKVFIRRSDRQRHALAVIILVIFLCHPSLATDQPSIGESSPERPTLAPVSNKYVQTADQTTSEGKATTQAPIVEPTSPMDEPKTAEPTTQSPTSTTTTTTTTTTTADPAAPTDATTKKPIECSDTKYCFNGGKCILNDLGYPQCICIEGFYGNRCQTKDICKSVIVDSLTGDQICAKLDRGCFKNDKFFRCSCHEDEYFIFKILQDPTSTTSTTNRNQTDQLAADLAKLKAQGARKQQGEQHQSQSKATLKRSKSPQRLLELINQQQQQQPPPHSDSATFAYDYTSNEDPIAASSPSSARQKKPPSYLAECRKVDKCLGIRCRQLSEVCSDGQCVCNQEAGYVADPTDANICKLLDPCSMPSYDKNKAPICGQAKCVATFNKDLFRCLCPVGHMLVQIGERKSSSVCAPLNDAICDVPLLNKCQHLCHIDFVQNDYRCSCFRGYKPGKRAGLDDHMCFFDDHSNDDPVDHDDDPAELEFESDGQSKERSAQDIETTSSRQFSHVSSSSDSIFRWYKIPQLGDPKFASPSNFSPYSSSLGGGGQKFTYDSELKPVPVPVRAEEEEEEEARTGNLFSDSDLKSLRPDQYLIKREVVAKLEGGRDSWDEWDESVAKMSAQERCNKMCGENRICVLENETTNSYRCTCDRQGYVSIGDKCLNWCAAAEFSQRIRVLLFKYGCWTQVCGQTADIHPQFADSSPSPEPQDDTDSRKSPDRTKKEDDGRNFLRLSSWRPQFECDCSSSPFLKQDPETRLCQLDFKATLEPCLPGNVGYIDCVENKNAYCAVLHRSSWSFMKDLIHDKYKDKKGSSKSDSESSSSSSSNSNSNSKSKSKQAKLANEKLYTCVCSPDKKFLVDKPRNKERCVDECDMLNIECVRFNRMCRSASIAPDDFGRNNLVRYDLDGAVKMNFRRTGCECLPGFNVGPTESLDFTLDDDVDEQANSHQANKQPSSIVNPASTPSSKDPDGYPMPDIVDSDDILDQAEHMRAKYINIDSSCLLDYDVVEFHASFKSPADFDPSWIKIRNPLPESTNAKRDNSNRGGCTGPLGNNTCDEPSGNSVVSEHKISPSSSRSHHQSSNETGFFCSPQRGCQLEVPKFMQYNISDLHKNIVLLAQCEPAVAMQSLDAYQECVRYRYWIIQKLRRHYVDWRRVVTSRLSETFDLMDGNIRLRVNRCESTLRSVSIIERNKSGESAGSDIQLAPEMVPSEYLDPLDPESIIDADIDCELTLHSASDGSSPRYSRKVLLEKQLQRFIFVEPAADSANSKQQQQFGDRYYLMAPNMLIRRESFDQLAEHRKLFNPCESDYAYCDMQTDCHMVDTVNFTCTCKFGYTPIGSRDIYYGDSRKEVCEDIDECLFDVCKDLAGVADCENTIGDYKCLCRNQYTGDNKRYCNHVCNTINCHHLHGKCRIVAPHHALCECEDGYKEADCSVQDPNVALRKANMIIVGSIFTSVLLLMITLAISLNSQLKKTKKKLKRLEAISATANLFELHTPQPFRPRMSKAS